MNNPKFDNPISTEEAYRLICTMNTDEGGRNAVSARGWIKHSSWLHSERMTLTDGSWLYREPFVEGDIWHSNMTGWDVLGEFFQLYKSDFANSL